MNGQSHQDITAHILICLFALEDTRGSSKGKKLIE